MAPGRVFRHEQFYLDCETGLLKPKYFLGLAVDSSGDCVARLLTRVLDLPATILVDVLDCAARADDTTRNQERAIRDELDRQRRKLS